MSSTEGKKPETLTIEEQGKVLCYAERVHTTAQKMMDVLVTDTADLPGPDRWMIMSRVLSGMFAHHFMISLNTAGGEMAKREQAKTAPPPETL